MVTVDSLDGHSDDDFDLIPGVPDADAVSDVSDEYEVKEKEKPHRAPPSRDAAGAGRLAGPHEVPQMPYAPDHDVAFPSIDQQLSDYKTRDRHRDPGIAKGSGSFIDHGLKYTKTVYNKLVSKDALIAVMGYVIMLSLATAKTLHHWLCC